MDTEDDIPETGAVFTFGKSKFADNTPSKFWLKNDIPLKISCGDEHTALITENGKLFMFGSNNWGQLGLGSKVSVTKPMCVKALKSEKVQLVACGRNHTIICTARGNVYATGGNSDGQLGLGDCEERTSFQLVAFFASYAPMKMVAAGSNTSAALTESGKLFMWGDNTEGQIGLGKESHASSPQEVSVGQPVSWVSCGYYHSAFVTVGGALYTFGERDSGKLGLGTDQLARHRVPQLVKTITEPVTQVACGGGHTVVLTEDSVYTFGLGQFGQLGHGTFIFESRLPRLVDHFRKGRGCQVACGENHTALITDRRLLYMYGDGRHGKLGLGDENFTNQFKPTLCPRFLKYQVQAVACGGCHTVVLAQPRTQNCGDVLLEDDDVTEVYLEKPYVELLGDTVDSSTVQRSLSARVRRRERERSPDQFGTMVPSVPAQVPVTVSRLPPPVSSQTVPARGSPTEWAHREVLNGLHRHDSSGSAHNDNGETDSAVESLTDADSVKGLGESTDVLNMTHVMKMDLSEETFTLSPVHKGLKGHTWSKYKEEDVQEDDAAEAEEEDEDDDDDAEEMTSAETDKPAEEKDGCEDTKPEEQKKQPQPDGQQTVSETALNDSEEPDASVENLKSQSGPSKKLSFFRRLSSSRSKQETDQTVSKDTSLHEEPSPADDQGNSSPPLNRGEAQQKVLSSRTKGPQSGTCCVL
ncbi:retinitis pigmentosa GTPase regulator b isoform X2 [Thalassophryne amazonica]|uniref:retinitis pigmentosa GTPase regulator b isoform X2 n=1 Tax=Thalassophryne amazonica TaxID=390379 RepID=UPI001470A8E0|nr:retinitis pigmentosa GTPase regulator b isoform X2 [Thalassophryne amazonica]